MYGKKKMSKHDYIEYIVNYLVNDSVEGATCIPKRAFNPSTDARLRDRHFPKKIPVCSNGKVQGIMCKACNWGILEKLSRAKLQHIGARNVKHPCALPLALKHTIPYLILE